MFYTHIILVSLDANSGCPSIVIQLNYTLQCVEQHINYINYNQTYS